MILQINLFSSEALKSMLLDDITYKYIIVSYSLNNHILSFVFNSEGMERKPETKRTNFEGMAMWEHAKDNKSKFFSVMSISQTKLTRIMSSFYLFMKEKFCNISKDYFVFIT